MDVLTPPRPDSLDDCPLPDCMQTPNIEDAQANNVVAPALPNSRKKALITLAAAFVIVGAVVGVLVATSHPSNPSAATVATVGSGADISICYDSYQDSLINQHFKTIRQRFTGVRTYQTRGYRNAIDAAADAGLKIYAGVWIRTDENSINADMQAVVDGVRRHPWNVKGVFVGNEELSNGIDQWTVLGRVRQMKQKLIDAGYGWIPVGSVQVDGDWFRAPDLAAGCDLIGANIHPFFSAGPDSTWNPLGDLDVRWKNIYAKFGAKAVVTETGWPTAGGQFNGHWPSMDMAKSYYTQFQNWARTNGGDMPAFFVFHDNTNKSPDYEVSFGLAWSNGYWKFDVNTDIKGIAFVNSVNDRVLAMAPNRQVEFHNRWGNDWVVDYNSLWTLRGPLVLIWEDSTKTDLCLDAYEPKNGGTVHLFPCDANNANQQWTYDSSTKLLRHATHIGFCLDLNTATTATPYLWTCHDVNDPYYPLQQLAAWIKA
ncbi:unnamed protein product [Aphanomyces euteiches]|uniref:glucan endo-1,3-beta-D-glucosidase n=1 Tax=Aphanomyces euteiches TaxID=100861 RepID=A0A6G0WCX9_9STRA|nr:hypothetical protein Ae201684_016457 [Aphanomyces euteiches]KAH9082342.1 hypothetical protein Ae201684P_009668 [Aphanomyces euteiches]KAH9140148.1 hypothetical protein AeRB84_015612 [Aphanomyces euteiches]